MGTQLAFVHANRIDDPAKLDEALDEFLSGSGPRMLVCEVDSENNVK